MRYAIAATIVLATAGAAAAVNGKKTTFQCVVNDYAFSRFEQCVEAKRLADAGLDDDLKRYAVKIADLEMPAPERPSPPARLFLRKSMGDLKSIASPNPLDKSSGAEFSWANDRVEDNRTWAAQGLLLYRWQEFGTPAVGKPYVIQELFGTYIGFDRTHNSRNITKNTDDLTFGGRYEVGFSKWNAAHYFSVGGEFVSNFDGESKNWNVNFEYLPVGRQSMNWHTPFTYIGNPHPLGSYLFWTFQPKLRAEYRGDLGGNTDPLFGGTDRVFRVGGALSLQLQPSFGSSDTLLGYFANRSLFNITYSWLSDTYTGREYSYLDTSFTYNIDPKDRLGVTLSYRRGDLETTGKQIDLVKLSLSAKFDYPPPVD